MTKANYIALFKELDNIARIEYSPEEEWHYRRTRRRWGVTKSHPIRFRQRDEKIRMRTEIMVY